jgi:hypothetical protein
MPAPRYLICLRDPDEAAKSLLSLPWAAKRLNDGLPQALALCRRYTSDALDQTRGQPRLLVEYRELRSDPAVVRRVAAFAGRADALAVPETQELVEAFIRPL